MIARTQHFTCLDHGSLVAFTILTPEAREWVEEHVAIPAHMRMGDFGGSHFMTFMCEAKHADTLITALLELETSN